MSIRSTFLPAKAQEYKLYKVTVYVRDLVTYKIEVAAKDRQSAQSAGDRMAMDHGYTPGFNCRVSVMVKSYEGKINTILVAK